MPDDAARNLAHGVRWHVRIAQPMGGRRAAGPDSYRRRTAVPGMQRIRPWSGRPCRGTGAQRQAACHRASGPASQARFRDAGYAVRSGFGVPSLGSSGGTELGVLRCWLARRWEDNQCVVADATLPSVMLDWVTRAIRLASSGSMRLGTCGRRQASWATGNPRACGIRPTGLPASSRFRGVCDREGVPGRGVHLRGRS